MTTPSIMPSTSKQFLTAFKPFSSENIDNVLNSIKDHENPFLAGFSLQFSALISMGFVFLNAIICTLVYINTDMDSALKFLSICSLFAFTSCGFAFLVYLIHKSRLEYFFIESTPLTRDVKKTFFYHPENLSSILKEIPLSMNSMSVSQHQQFMHDCEHSCLKNKDVQMIYHMVKTEKWLRIKQKITFFIQKISQKTLNNVKNKCKP